MNEGMECCVSQTTPKPNPSATIHARCWTSTDHLAHGIAAGMNECMNEKAKQCEAKCSKAKREGASNDFKKLRI